MPPAHREAHFSPVGGMLQPSERGEGAEPFLLTEVPTLCSGSAGAGTAPLRADGSWALIGVRGTALLVQLPDLLLLFAAGGHAEGCFRSYCHAGSAQLLQVVWIWERATGRESKPRSVCGGSRAEQSSSPLNATLSELKWPLPPALLLLALPLQGAQRQRGRIQLRSAAATHRRSECGGSDFRACVRSAEPRPLGLSGIRP